MIDKSKQSLIDEINKRVDEKILERTNADLLIKLITNADTLDEAINIAALGTTYKRTGLHFDKRLEKMGTTIKYFKKNEALSFHSDDNKPTHKLIIGDNYEALQNLLVQYKGKINVIYIDPPYGKDSMGEFAKTNYDNAITRDNLLSMLYPRLQLAKQLLSDDGVIFCSIDDKNQAYVKCLFDEVMGEENFVNNLIWKKTENIKMDSHFLSQNKDYVLIYRKSANITDFNKDYSNEDRFKLTDEKGKYYLRKLDSLSSSYSRSMDYVIEYNGKKYYAGGSQEKYKKRQLSTPPKKGPIWLWSKEKYEKGLLENEIVFKNGNVYNKVRFDGMAKKPFIDIQNIVSQQTAQKQFEEIFDIRIFDYPKPYQLISWLVNLVTFSKNAIILDFFAGSGTTGHAVLDLNKQDGGNRSFILCQLNEKTETTPNGIAYDVTSKRLKRVMTGECYDGTKDFKWIEKNEAYGGNLDVYEIESVSNFEWTDGKTPFDVIDETLYGKEQFTTTKEKIEWVCSHFDKTQKYLESKTEE